MTGRFLHETLRRYSIVSLCKNLQLRTDIFLLVKITCHLLGRSVYDVFDLFDRGKRRVLLAIFHRIGLRRAAAVLIGMVLGIGSLSALSYLAGAPLLVASFGASAVFLYAAPSSPMARKRNVAVGHVLSACCGVAAYALLGDTWYAVTLALLVATFLMLATNTLHPPGGATAVFAVMGHAGPIFILTPVLLGALILIGVSYLSDLVAPKGDIPLKQHENGAISVVDHEALKDLRKEEV